MALDETINDEGILPYKEKRHNIYTAIENMGKPSKEKAYGNIYEAFGWKD
jgi:hypothetical protein